MGLKIASKSFLLSEAHADSSSDQIASFAEIDQSGAVISLLPRFVARFRPFWITPNKQTSHALVNRIFLRFKREKDAHA